MAIALQGKEQPMDQRALYQPEECRATVWRVAQGGNVVRTELDFPRAALTLEAAAV
jgi:hypothetical protein